MSSIEDTYALQLPLQDLTDFDNYLSQHFTASALVDFVEKSFVIPSEYNCSGLIKLDTSQ
ncbi:hypothetical protein Psal006b_03532 (plasmid) [Piscirickettsia salmonis]|nr:hypothetical protein PSLF89_06335 [Piscirickettsia salmonis LF-89 = ATCC VR-1361]ALY03008.1 hypothetical protein AWE47_09265 [Piscirickettsia salmonis]AMA42566.1 hypothetical protein AWJ11_09470 [Piscirickettsia salmonis]AOS35036.1 hypothetical protein AVM72_06610 [Piscirickettsia salmonis]APS59744.1 hypothetical protein AVI53_03540 [Piscirickettsia salmonis]